MKLIKTVVRSNQVDEVRAALGKLHIAGMTVTDVRAGDRRQAPFDPGGGNGVSTHSGALIELIVRDEVVADATQAIFRSARSGAFGHGRMSVIPLDHGEN